jgi:hypothetical protein
MSHAQVLAQDCDEQVQRVVRRTLKTTNRATPGRGKPLPAGAVPPLVECARE